AVDHREGFEQSSLRGHALAASRVPALLEAMLGELARGLVDRHPPGDAGKYDAVGPGLAVGNRGRVAGEGRDGGEPRDAHDGPPPRLHRWSLPAACPRSDA